MKNKESFTVKALNNGFKPFPEYFNGKDNYFGVSTLCSKGYTPDAIITKGNKQIAISLQGAFMPMPKLITPEIQILLNNRSTKYIGFFIDKKAIYQTWSGEMPTEEFINNFIYN